jgi:hypothetical protein
MSRNPSKLAMALFAGLVAVTGAWGADCASAVAGTQNRTECMAPAPRAITVKVLDAASGLVMKDDGQTITLEHEKATPVRQEPMIRVRSNSAAQSPQMVTLAW